MSNASTRFGCCCPECERLTDENRLARRAFKKEAVAAYTALNIDGRTAGELAESCARKVEGGLPIFVRSSKCWMTRPTS